MKMRPLFSYGELREILENRKKQALVEVQQQDPNYILNVNPSELCKYIMENFSLEPIVLDEAKISVAQEETNVDVSGDPNRWIRDRSRPFYLTGTRVTYFIPFEGN